MSNRVTPIPAHTDSSQMVAMINQNFAELDNQAVSSQLLIVQSGTHTIPAGTATYDGTSQIPYAYGKVIPHNLGLRPIMSAYALLESWAVGDEFFISPSPKVYTLLPAGSSSVFVQPARNTTSGTGGLGQWFVHCDADEKNIYISGYFAPDPTFGATTLDIDEIPIKYYIFQEGQVVQPPAV